MDHDILFRIEEEAPITFKLIEGEQKPEQEKSVMPKYTPQTVTPDPGKTLSLVRVAAIPDPTAVETFTQNGEYDVARVGTAVVAVPMPAGTKQITENGTGIDVAAFAFADVNVPQGVFPSGTKIITENGIENVREYENVNVQVPQPSGKITITENGNDVDIAQYSSADIAVPQGVFPSGTLDITENRNDIDVELYQKVNVNVPGIVPSGTKQINITQNGTTTEDVMDYAEAEITVNTLPEKGLVFEDYDADGYPTTARFVGTWSGSCPVFGDYYKTNCYLGKIKSIIIPNGITRLEANAFIRCDSLETIVLPQTLTTLVGTFTFYGVDADITIPASFTTWVSNQQFSSYSGKRIVFEGNCPDMPNSCFSGASKVELYDFSHCTNIPSLYSVVSLGHKNGCVIRIPADLSDTTLGVGNGWESATNWNALTNIVWEVV